MRTVIAILLLSLGLFFYAGQIGSAAAAAAGTEPAGENLSAGGRQYPSDSDAGNPAGSHQNSRSGAVRVDRDLYPYHYDDVNQFGDDEAYNSMSGQVKTGVRYPIHREDP